MGVLEGRTAIVTGGARGIGLAIARRYVAEGARVVIADIDESAGKAAVAVVGRGDSVVIKPGDTVTIDFGGSFNIPSD